MMRLASQERRAKLEIDLVRQRLAVDRARRRMAWSIGAASFAPACLFAALDLRSMSIAFGCVAWVVVAVLLARRGPSSTAQLRRRLSVLQARIAQVEARRARDCDRLPASE